MASQIIGIDLGTTNSALASVSATDDTPVDIFSIAQVMNPGEVGALDLLSSSVYLPNRQEFSPGALALPWNPDPSYVAGRFARLRGLENASRLVSSAKSWLANTGADPNSALLPLNAPDGIERISPLEASTRILAHLRSAWNNVHAEAPMESQEVLVTVPASFDPGARDLTVKAAALAGLGQITLLEEPQAAFYSWIERTPGWRERVKPGDNILVIDIGGGTTDFTLISVVEEQGELALRRIAVGEHLLLGGDNMDLAAARYAEAQLAAKGTRLEAVQFQALWQQCRHAKEVLLGSGGEPEQTLTVLGRGTGLIGGTIRSRITREEIRTLLLDGFFPIVGPDATVQRQRRTALAEVGLPYAHDPAITKHLAQFLRGAGTQDGALAAPTHLLFNGGVLQAQAIEDRLLEVINSWLPQPVQLLRTEDSARDLMHAVARGAAYYGRAKQSGGVRIRGGVPRTYYIGIESSLPAIPGLPAPMKAFAVVPFGLEEGSHVEMPQKRFALVVGEAAEFRFFSSASRRDDPPGTLLEEITDELEELPPMEVILPAGAENRDEIVPVTIQSNVTETGLLELWCVAADGRRWKLEFNVRERAAAA